MAEYIAACFSRGSLTTPRTHVKLSEQMRTIVNFVTELLPLFIGVFTAYFWEGGSSRTHGAIICVVTTLAVGAVRSVYAAHREIERLRLDAENSGIKSR